MVKSVYREFQNNINDTTSCDIYFNDNPAPQPIAIWIHGFRAFRGWGFLPYFATNLAKNNIVTICLDFSLNTVADYNTLHFDMSRFRRNTVTQMITEIKLLIDMLHNNSIINDLPIAWNKNIFLIGHSLGGGLAIATADNNFAINKLVTICSICDFDIYSEKQKEKWLETGTKEFIDSTTGQRIILNVDFLTDRLTYKNDKAILAMVSRLNVPYLVVHTAADATVLPSIADKLLAAGNQSLTKKIIIPKANHQINCSHPFVETNPALDTTIESVVEFFRN